MKKARIGILGGSFDPPHLGHLYLAEGIGQMLKLDMILFVPSGDPYHKHKPTASKSERCTMVNLAIAGNPRFRLNRVDVDRYGPTYSVDTAKDIRGLFGKKAKFFFLIGADNIKKIRTWKYYKTFLNLVKVVALPRPGTHPHVRSEGRIGRKIVELFPCHTLNISSKQIRSEIKANMTAVRYKLPPRVWRYIQKKGLYL